MADVTPASEEVGQLPLALDSLATIAHKRGHANNERWLRLAADESNRLAGIQAAYTDFESTGDLHELARAVGVILNRRENG